MLQRATDGQVLEGFVQFKKLNFTQGENWESSW